MKKQQATTEFSGKIMKRWYGIYSKDRVSVAWAETIELATEKFKKCDAGLESVLPAPSAIEEVRPLKSNMSKNVAIVAG